MWIQIFAVFLLVSNNLSDTYLNLNTFSRAEIKLFAETRTERN